MATVEQIDQQMIQAQREHIEALQAAKNTLYMLCLKHVSHFEITEALDATSRDVSDMHKAQRERANA